MRIQLKLCDWGPRELPKPQVRLHCSAYVGPSWAKAQRQLDRGIRPWRRTWRLYGLCARPQQSDHQCGHLQCLGAWWAASWGIIQALRCQGDSSPHGQAHPTAWTSARSSAAHAQRWSARHGAPLVGGPILRSTAKIRLALLHYPSDASRPSRPQPLDDHNVSGICLACKRYAYLG